MSSAGRAASISDCVVRPRARAIGLIGFAVQTQRSSLTGSYVMETAEHREPCESRGSRTVLGARGGEIPPRDSTHSALLVNAEHDRFTLGSGLTDSRSDVAEGPKSRREQLQQHQRPSCAPLLVADLDFEP